MSVLALFYINEDGEPISYDDQVTCLATDEDGAFRTFCSGQVYNEGEGGARAIAIELTHPEGLTCPKCRKKLKDIKRVMKVLEI